MHLLKLQTENLSVVTVDDAKAQSSVFVDDDNAFLQTKIDQALEQVAKDTRRTLIDTQWRLTLAKFEPVIKLPKPPLIEIVSIEYADSAGVLQSIAPADCQLSVSDVGTWLRPPVSQRWPATQQGNENAVTIIYRAGYVRKVGEATEGALPPSLKQAVLLWAAHLYDMREAFTTAQVNELPAYGCMIAPFEVDLI